MSNYSPLQYALWFACEKIEESCEGLGDPELGDHCSECKDCAARLFFLFYSMGKKKVDERSDKSE